MLSFVIPAAESENHEYILPSYTIENANSANQYDFPRTKGKRNSPFPWQLPSEGIFPSEEQV